MAGEDCIRCGRVIEDWDNNYMSRGMLCPSCYADSMVRASDKTSLCTRCGLHISPKDANLSTGTTLCKKCFEEETKYAKEHFCAICTKKIEGASFQKDDGGRVCMDCMRDQSPGGSHRSGARTCDRCGRDAMVRQVTADGENLCMECAQRAKKGILSGMFGFILGKRS
jgi:formylmethanofuran dehydrogenase subunit E